MQVSVEMAEGLKRRVKVEVPAERIETEVQNRLKSLTRRAKVDGFRPGKVPFSVVQRRFGGQVRQEVVDELVQSSLYDALVDKDLRPVARPRIGTLSQEPGKGLEYTATFEVYPEIKVGALDGVKIERPVTEITEQDLDGMVDVLRKQRPRWNEVDTPAETGDRLVVDYTATMEGEVFEGNSGEQLPVIIGSNTYVEGFEKQLVGAKAGDEVHVDVVFPDDFQNKKLAGRAVQFVVNVRSVAKQELPEVDEAFIKSFGVESGELEAFRSEVKQNMQRELDQAIKGQMKQRAMDALLEVADLEVPQALVDNETENLMEQARASLAERVADSTQAAETQRPELAERAHRRVVLGLIMAEIIKSNDLKAPPEKVREAVSTIASTYETPQEVVDYYYGNRERLGEIESVVLEDEVVAWVLERAKVVESPMPYAALMHPGTDK